MLTRSNAIQGINGLGMVQLNAHITVLLTIRSNSLQHVFCGHILKECWFLLIAVYEEVRSQ